MSHHNYATKQKFVAPLARAKGHGSAHEGVHTWMMERITAALLIPYVFWIAYSVLLLRGASYEDFTAWLATPWNAVLMLVFILAAFYHAAAGLQVVIEDYVASHTSKLLMVVGVKITFLLLGVASIFSILKIAL